MKVASLKVRTPGGICGGMLSVLPGSATIYLHCLHHHQHVGSSVTRKQQQLLEYDEIVYTNTFCFFVVAGMLTLYTDNIGKIGYILTVP